MASPPPRPVPSATNQAIYASQGMISATDFVDGDGDLMAVSFRFLNFLYRSVTVKLTLTGTYSQILTQDTSYLPFGPVPFLFADETGTDDANGAVFYLYGNSPPVTEAEPVALSAYSKLAATSTGNQIFGLYGLCELASGLASGTAIGCEFTVRNNAGTPDYNLPPNQAIGTPTRVANALQVTCGGAYDCSIGIQMGSEGGATNRFGTLIYGKGDYVGYGIFLEATPLPASPQTMVLKNNGSNICLLLQTINPTIAGNPVLDVYDNTGASQFAVFQNGDLTIAGANATKPGSTSWVNPSERALKTDIQPYTQGLQAILALNPVSYRYSGKHELPSAETHIGLVHDETAHMPEMHRTVTIGKAKAAVDALDCGALTFALINAVKELTARVRELEDRIR